MPKNSNAGLFKSLTIGAFKYNFKGKEGFKEMNCSLPKIFGYKNEQEMQKVNFKKLIINKKEYGLLVDSIRSGKKLRLFEVACTNKDNKVIWVALSAKGTRSNGSIDGMTGIIQKMSASKAAKNSHMQEDSLQSILDSIPDAIYFKDKKNRITRVNKFYAKGFKSKKEDLLGKTDFDFFPEDQAHQMFSDDNNILKTGKPMVGKIERTLLPNGTWNQVITTKIPMFDNQGKIIGTMGITRDMTSHANLERERFVIVLNALMVLSRALELRDPYTQTHARDVAKIAHMIGKELGFSDNKLMGLRVASELHDLGKIGVPLDILIKPGKLSELEFSLVREHTDKCFNLIKDIEFPFPLAEIIYQHHERLDGSGYPRGLKGKQILLEARILAVSDVLEAMTNHRPYRAALGIKKAVAELKSGYGTKYDKKIVDIALNLVRKNKGNPFWIS